MFAIVYKYGIAQMQTTWKWLKPRNLICFLSVQKSGFNKNIDTKLRKHLIPWRKLWIVQLEWIGFEKKTFHKNVHTSDRFHKYSATRWQFSKMTLTIKKPLKCHLKLYDTLNTNTRYTSRPKIMHTLHKNSFFLIE